MKDITTALMQQFRREHKAARRYMALLLALALLTSLFVNWQLHSVGIAQTADYQCGEIEHQHTAECYEKVLVCGYEEGEPEDWNATKPDDSAFPDADYGVEQSEADIAAYSAEPEPEYIFVPHQHTDDCYQEVKTLTCYEEEHVHTDDCFDPEDGSLICDLFEHTHDDSCYSIEYELVCGLEEGELVEEPNPNYVPVDEEAFAVFDDAVALQPVVDDSSLDTPVHHHTDACYEEVLVCGLPEHHHTVNCLSDPLADVEDEETWSAKTNVVLTGAWADDLTAVAKSQLGYQQSERNFKLDDEDQTTVRHYTRYGAWYGNAYGAWDVMFLSYCLNYADVPQTTVPQRAGVQALRSDLRGSEWLKAAAEVELVPGDIVFYNSITTETVAVEEDAPQIMDDSADADIALLSLEPAAAEPQTEERTVSTETVGIVSDVDADTGTLTVISGDVDGKVAEVPLRADEITDVIDLAAAHKAQEEDRPSAGGISHEELGEQESAVVIWPISEEELAQYPMMLSAELDETDAAGNPELTVTNVTFQRREGNNWPDIQQGDTVEENDEIRMYVDFTLKPNTFTQLPGTIDYQLPRGLKLEKPITNGVIRRPPNTNNGEEGEPVGSYTIDKDGKVKMTFDEGKINPADAFNGTIMFTARANYSSSKNGEITFGNNIKLQIQKPDPDLHVEKGFAEKVMWSDEKGDFYIHWKVTVTTKNGSGSLVDIWDELPQGYLPSSFDPDNSKGPVSITRYDAAGTVKPLTGEYNKTYELSPDGKKLSYTDLPELQAGEKYELRYVTKITAEDLEKAKANNTSIVMFNTANAKAGEIKRSKDEKVSFLNTLIEKKGNLNSSGLIDWTVTIKAPHNDNGGFLKNYVLTDQILKGDVSIVGSITIRSNNGKTDTITPEEFATGYRLSEVDNNAYEYTVTYQTTAPASGGIVENQAKITRGEVEFTANASKNVPVGKWGLTKTHVRNNEKGIAYWTIEASNTTGAQKFELWDTIGATTNSAGQTVAGTTHYAYAAELQAALESGMTESGMTLSLADGTKLSYAQAQAKGYLGNITYYDADGNVVPADNSKTPVMKMCVPVDTSKDPTVRVTRVELAGIPTHEELSSIPQGDAWTFHNDAKLIQGGSEVSAPATDTRHGDSIFTKEVSTDGQNYAQNISPVDYNVNADHRLYYKITLVTTADQKGIIEFSDRLPDDMTYTPDSNSNSCYRDDTFLSWTGGDWHLNYNSNTHTVTVQAKNLTPNKEYKITFKYSVTFDKDPGWKDLLTAKREYTNTASWGSGKNEKIATTTTTVTREVEPLTKTGEQQKNSNNELNNCITYTVIINPAKETLGNGETLDLKDVMTVNTDSGASFYGSNVKLYYYEHGKSVSEMTPVPPGQYTNLEPEGNEWLHMTVRDRTALLLQYDCIIANNRNEPVLSNTVSLNQYQKEQKLQFKTNDSSVTVSSGQLVIKKVDGTTWDPLPNAKFTLTPYDTKTKQFDETASMSDTTNASGELVFHITSGAVLPHVLYRLQETEAPAGYIKDSTPRYVFFYEREENPAEKYQEFIGAEAVQDGATTVQAENVTFGTTTGATTLTVQNTCNQLTVTKTWLNASNNRPADEDDIPQQSIQVQLYRHKAGQTTADKVGDPVMLSKTNNWSYTWEGTAIPATDTDGQKWCYSVQELDTGLWKTTYSANNENGIQTGNIYITNTIYSSYELPSTGGMGTVPFAAVGGMLTMGAALLLAKRKKHEEKGE